MIAWLWLVPVLCVGAVFGWALKPREEREEAAPAPPQTPALTPYERVVLAATKAGCRVERAPIANSAGVEWYTVSHPTLGAIDCWPLIGSPNAGRYADGILSAIDSIPSKLAEHEKREVERRLSALEAGKADHDRWIRCVQNEMKGAQSYAEHLSERVHALESAPKRKKR